MVDEDALCENRFVIALHKAALRKKHHAIFLSDPYTRYYLEFLPQESPLWITDSCGVGMFYSALAPRGDITWVPHYFYDFRTPAERGKTQWEKKEIPLGRKGIDWCTGCALSLCQYLVHSLGIKRVEMYGVDLEPVEFNTQYTAQKRAFETWFEADGSLEFVNCSPSSACDIFPREEHPWTSQCALSTTS